MKLFYVNKTNESIACIIPKLLYKALGWKAGDKLEATIGKDRTIILKKQEA